MNNAELIKREGLIVIMRGVGKDRLECVLNALYNGGARIVEIAFDPSDAGTILKTSSLISMAAKLMGDKLIIGAGTVICEEYLMAAYSAGAKFIFSPDVNPDVIRLTKNLGLVSIPGAMTPTECMTAHRNGADIIKLFPMTQDKVEYIKNIMRPLSHLSFICVGGTNENTIETFIKAGAIGVGTGISILKPELIQSENYAEISRLTALHLEKINEARLTLSEANQKAGQRT